MPQINLEFDDSKVSTQEAEALSRAVQKIVVDVTGIKDVFVYGNSAQIKIQIAPIEIFVKISASKVTDLDQLFEQIKQSLVDWKTESKFEHPINLTVIPMNWKFGVGI